MYMFSFFRISRSVSAAFLCAALSVSASLWAMPACSAPSALSVSIESPTRVARGDAFEVTASVDSSAPLSSLSFVWMGKSVKVPTYGTNAANAANAAGNRAYATLLLPVPVDAKEDELLLQVKAGGSASAQQRVSLYNKERPVQKLTVDKKFTSPPAHEKERIAADRRRVAEAVSRFTPQRQWTLPLLRPVEGSISSQFGLRRVYNGATKSIHRGLDMRSPMGTPILAVADGEVVLADLLYYSGNAVYIDHGLGLVTSYMHMSELLVQPGQKVQRGEVIGKVGSTGQSTGPHLHLGLMVLGTAVDSVPFMTPRLTTQSAQVTQAGQITTATRVNP